MCRLRWPLAWVALASVLLGCGGGGGGGAGSSITPGLVVIAWTAPSSNTDGSPLADIAGYRVIYGTDSQQLTQSLDLSSATTTTAQISGLAAGTYYVRVQTVSASGGISDPSNTAVITLP